MALIQVLLFIIQWKKHDRSPGCVLQGLLHRAPDDT